MKLTQLDSILSQVQPIKNPNILLEQYNTPSYLASQILFYIYNYNKSDVEHKMVAEFCCGSGVFVLGLAILNTAYCIGFDIDQKALDVALLNARVLDLDHKVDFVQLDLLNLQNFEQARYNNRLAQNSNSSFNSFIFDTIVMNPPFGTKHNKGVDLSLLNVAISCSRVVYSLHKSSTRKYLISKLKERNLKVKVVAELKFDIPNTYKFHKKKNVEVFVDLIRIQNE